jgi:excisionase family DNA binding protein
MTTEGFNPIEWITTTEAAELTGYKPVTFRWLVKEGRIKGQKRGRDWFLSKADVLAYTEEMKQLGTAKHDPWRTGARQRTD